METDFADVKSWLQNIQWKIYKGIYGFDQVMSLSAAIVQEIGLINETVPAVIPTRERLGIYEAKLN